MIKFKTLLCCPFCGEDAAMWTGGSALDSLGYIECRSCRARTGNDLDIYGDSRAKWNSRKYTPEGIVETVKDSAFYNEPKAPEIYYINIKVLKERL